MNLPYQMGLRGKTQNPINLIPAHKAIYFVKFYLP